MSQATGRFRRRRPPRDPHPGDHGDGLGDALAPWLPVHLHARRHADPARARVCGRAVTLRFGPGRPDLATSEADRNTKDPMWVAIEALGPGDFLVMDCGGNQSGATTGDILAARIKYRGAVGILCDGAIRDAAQIRELVGLPAWSLGVQGLGFTPNLVSLDWNMPVRCFGVTVMPGDYILADDDGAVMIPAALAQEIADVCSEQEHKEEFIRGLVQQGVPVSECYPPNAATLEKYEAWKKSGH